MKKGIVHPFFYHLLIQRRIIYSADDFGCTTILTKLHPHPKCFQVGELIQLLVLCRYAHGTKSREKRKGNSEQLYARSYKIDSCHNAMQSKFHSKRIQCDAMEALVFLQGTGAVVVVWPWPPSASFRITYIFHLQYSNTYVCNI